MAIQVTDFDAIVVGSGVSGGYATKELCELGFKVLLIERGRNVKHIEDYKTSMSNPWDMSHRGRLSKEEKSKFPILTRVHNKVNEYTSAFFSEDIKYPYIEEQRFDWVRGYQLGGKSLTWGRIALRMSDLDFGANQKENVSIDWPIRYKDISPWYDRIEKFVGVAGSKNKLHQLPDGIFQPPMPFTCVENDFKAKLLKSNSNIDIIHARQAHLTKPTEEQMALGRASCQYRNMCSRGCPYGAYFSSQSATLPAARLTNNLTLLTDSVVKEIYYNDVTQKAEGVIVIDAITKEETKYKAKVIFLNGSTLATTQILLNSKSKRYPDGFGNDSGVLGKFLMDHHFGAGATAEVPDFEDTIQYGRRPNGFYIPRYQNLIENDKKYLRGFGYEGNSLRLAKEDSGDFGENLKNTLSSVGPWKISLNAFAETLPYEDNKVYLSKTEKDEWGMPLLTITAQYKENEQNMRLDMKNDAAEFLQNAGYNNIKSYDEIRGFGRCIHEMGTARMGKSADSSILNANNQVWGAPNVFVTDGSCMTSSSCVNPSLTYMAFAARAAHFASDALKAKNI